MKAAFPAPVFGVDYDYLAITADMPEQAELALGIPDDTMEPYIPRHTAVYVARRPVRRGEVGLFYVEGQLLCRQYVPHRLGMTYLLCLNRARADRDVTLSGGRQPVCLGLVLLEQTPPIPR